MKDKELLPDRPYNQPFPTRLRELLDRKRGGQRELAEYLGKTSQAVGYYKDGSTIPDGSVLSAIADFYNVSTDYLLGRSDVKRPEPDIQAAAQRYGLGEEALNTIESLSDAEKWSLEILLQSGHFTELLHSIARCYAARQSVHFEEAVIRANQSKWHTLTAMTAHTPEAKEAWSSIQAELSRLQKKNVEGAKNAEAAEVIRMQRIAASIGEEVCELAGKEADPDGNDQKT